MASMGEQPKKGEDVLALMPYIRRDSDINFDPQNREKMRKTEMERQKCNFYLTVEKINCFSNYSERNDYGED